MHWRGLGIGLITAIVVGLVGLFTALNLGLGHRQLQALTEAKLGLHVRLGAVHLTPFWPLQVSVGATQVESSQFDLKWKSARVKLSRIRPPYGLTIELEEPLLEWHEGGEAVTEERTQPAAPPHLVVPDTALRVRLEVENGEWRSKTSHWTAIRLNFEQDLWLHSALKLQAEAQVENSNFPGSVPLAVETNGGATLTADSLHATDVTLSSGGLTAHLEGQSRWSEQRHDWRISLAARDLSTLKQAPFALPMSNWRGALEGHLRWWRAGTTAPWSGSGDLLLSQVQANAHFVRAPWTVEGPVRIEAQLRFQYLDNVTTLPVMNTHIDLDQARVSLAGLIEKPSGIPLHFTSRASSAALGGLDLERVEAQLWNFVSVVHGRVDPNSSLQANLHLDIPRLRLQGLEQIFLPLGQTPVSGEFELHGQVDGPLVDLRLARLRLEALQLKEFSGTLDYAFGHDFKIRGPLEASLMGKADIQQGKVLQLQARGRLNLDPAALVAGPWRKDAGQELNVEVQARDTVQTLQIQNLDIASFAGRLKLSGQVQDMNHPKVRLKVGLTAVNLDEMRIALPQFHNEIPQGMVSGELRLEGRMPFSQPWLEWPLIIGGNVRFGIKDFTFVPHVHGGANPRPTDSTSTTATALSAVPESLLPNRPLTSRLNLNLKADVATLTTADLRLKGVHVEGLLNKGHFKGELAIQRLFSGELIVHGLDIPLLSARPVLNGEARWNAINIEEALTYAAPKNRELARGKTAGITEFLSYWPNDRDFLHFLKAKGEFTLDPVTMDSLRVGKMVNELLKQVPLIKAKPVQEQAFHGRVTTHFELHSQVMNFEKFMARDEDGSELQLNGKVIFPALQGDLAGNFLWAKPQVKGCFLEGNSDAQGRLVIPVAVEGDLMHPGLTSLSGIIVKMGSRALNCEHGKFMDKLKSGDTKNLEEELKKQLKGILGH